jgi:TolA protein
MKGSLITSMVLHGLLAAWLLFSFGSPKPFEVTATESMPVELVPIEELTQIQQGDKEAPKKEDSATEITKREDQVDNAQNNGDNNFDLKSVPTPVEKPDNIQKAGAPEKSEKIVPDKADKPVNVEDIIKEEPQVEPATELAAKAEPKVEVKPEPRPDDVKAEKPVEEAKAEPVPDNVPVPATRPEIVVKKEDKKEETKDEPKPEKTEDKKEAKKSETAEAKTAKTEVKKKREQNKKSAKSTTSKESDFNADEVAELLNKTDNEAGGAKRNKKTRAFGGERPTGGAKLSLGGERPTGGAKLSQNEMDALKGLIEKNWSIMPGQVTSNDIVITVKMQLDESGQIVGDLEVSSKGGDDTARGVLERSAARAVKKSAPFDQLPKDKYDTWSEVVVNFSPSELM